MLPFQGHTCAFGPWQLLPVSDASGLFFFFFSPFRHSVLHPLKVIWCSQMSFSVTSVIGPSSFIHLLKEPLSTECTLGPVLIPRDTGLSQTDEFSVLVELLFWPAT